MTGDQASGIIGCLDPTWSWGRDLAEWAEERGATPACAEDGFRLWTWARPPTEPGLVRTADLCGLIRGERFPPPEQPANALTAGKQVAAAYDRRGADFIQGWSGQLSLVLWDRRKRELLLYRDDSSSHSLYYRQRGSSGMVFSNRLDLLVESPAVEKRLSERSLHEYLRFLDISSPNSIYDGVFSTEPGALLVCGPDGVRPPGAAGVAEPTAGTDDLEAATDALDRILGAAVASRVASAGTTVVFLSGGVDSALLCALAAERPDSRVTALTIGFDEPRLDESGIAQAVAGHLEVPHDVLRFPMATYREAFDELTAGIEYPYADPAGVPTLLAFRTARDLGDVALDGTGADTLLGVLPARHQRLAVQYGALLPPALRRLAAGAMGVLPVVRGYAPLVDFDDPEEVLIRWRGFSRREIEDLCGAPVFLDHTRFYRLFRSFPRHAHLERYSALMGNLPDDRIHQASLLTGLAVRFPYFDPAVAVCVRGMPADIRYRHSAPKRVLKAVLGRHVPRRLWDVPKHGFDFPFQQLLAANDHALVKDYLAPARTASLGLFDPDELDAIVRTFLSGDGRHAFRVWALVVLFAWLENHFRQLPG
jgi:asparagine synthase (glutamine-hydrolysing)